MKQRDREEKEGRRQGGGGAARSVLAGARGREERVRGI